MSETPVTAPLGQTEDVGSSLRRLVQTRLRQHTEQDLMAFILQRRTLPDDAPPKAVPVPYRKIAQELVDATGVDITHEAVRRWHRAYERAQAELAVTAS